MLEPPGLAAKYAGRTCRRTIHMHVEYSPYHTCMSKRALALMQYRIHTAEVHPFLL